MSDSLRLSVPDLSNTAAASDFFRVADAARESDGYDPFNEQARLDLASGHRTPVVATVTSTDAVWQPDADSPALDGHTVGAAIVGAGELDLVIDPVFRGKGYAAVALPGLLSHAHGELTAWSHGDHPAARLLAPRFGFEPVRTLLQLKLAPLQAAAPGPTLSKTTEISSKSVPEGRILPLSSKTPSFSTGSSEGPGGSITSFRGGLDEDEWVALNARVFAAHPEQGRVTVGDLRAREAEPWFDAGDFLVARDASGTMIGYNWLKIEPGESSGEVYVIGVDAASAGHGLGRRLMLAGLARLAERGCASATLYVEADNEPAVRLYRSLGFADHTVDVQYRRTL
jgi:mycothiol synthase